MVLTMVIGLMWPKCKYGDREEVKPLSRFCLSSEYTSIFFTKFLKRFSACCSPPLTSSISGTSMLRFTVLKACSLIASSSSAHLQTKSQGEILALVSANIDSATSFLACGKPLRSCRGCLVENSSSNASIFLCIHLLS